MKIIEIIESKKSEKSEILRKVFQNAIDNFDIFIEYHGTEGANVFFTDIIEKSKEAMFDFCHQGEKSYNKMIETRDKLEEKIKNSNGITYESYQTK